MPPPIARFNVVPGQAFSNPFNVGIVAFHRDGIGRVDVYWGERLEMGELKPNLQSGTVEYWVTIDPRELDAGPLEVRAEVFAKTGEMLELTTLLYPKSPARWLTARPNTLAEALKQAEGDQDAHWTIGLEPGIYRYPEVNSYAGWDRWLTLEPMSGVARDQVVLTHGDNPMVKHLRLRGLRLRQEDGKRSILACRSSTFGNHFWLDGCRIEGTGYLGPNKSTAPALASGDALSWYTDCEILNTCATGLHRGVQLARNVRGINIGGDFINHSTMSINCRVDRMRFDGGVHPDVVQCPVGEIDNMIVYGLEAYDVRAQGLTIGDPGKPCRNVALVDIRMEKGQDAGEDVDPQVSRLPRGSITDNIFMRRVLSRSYTWEMVEGDRTNLSIRECQFAGVVRQPGFSVGGQDVDNNVFSRPMDAFGGFNL